MMIKTKIYMLDVNSAFSYIIKNFDEEPIYSDEIINNILDENPNLRAFKIECKEEDDRFDVDIFMLLLKKAVHDE